MPDVHLICHEVVTSPGRHMAIKERDLCVTLHASLQGLGYKHDVRKRKIHGGHAVADMLA